MDFNGQTILLCAFHLRKIHLKSFIKDFIGSFRSIKKGVNNRHSNK